MVRWHINNVLRIDQRRDLNVGRVTQEKSPSQAVHGSQTRSINHALNRINGVYDGVCGLDGELTGVGVLGHCGGHQFCGDGQWVVGADCGDGHGNLAVGGDAVVLQADEITGGDVGSDRI